MDVVTCEDVCYIGYMNEVLMAACGDSQSFTRALGTLCGKKHTHASLALGGNISSDSRANLSAKAALQLRNDMVPNTQKGKQKGANLLFEQKAEEIEQISCLRSVVPRWRI